MNEKTYLRSQFRDIPEAVSALLMSLEGFKGHGSWPRDYLKLAESLADKEPFAVILFAEPLAQKHWRYKKYVDMRKIEVISELDDVVFKHFGNKLNRKMSEYLEHHIDPDNTYLNELMKSYYPQAKEILRSEYELFYPRSWKKKWCSGKYSKPRIKVEKKRRYEMPRPLCWEDTLSPQQFYFMKKTRTFVRGCSTGSGTRENQSYFWLAFLNLSKRVAIPTYIFVYDKDNVLRFIDLSHTFMIVPNSMGSNCHEDPGVIDALMRTAFKVRAVRSKDWTKINKINVSR